MYKKFIDLLEKKSHTSNNIYIFFSNNYIEQLNESILPSSPSPNYDDYFNFFTGMLTITKPGSSTYTHNCIFLTCNSTGKEHDDLLLQAIFGMLIKYKVPENQIVVISKDGYKSTDRSGHMKIDEFTNFGSVYRINRNIFLDKLLKSMNITDTTDGYTKFIDMINRRQYFFKQDVKVFLNLNTMSPNVTLFPLQSLDKNITVSAEISPTQDNEYIKRQAQYTHYKDLLVEKRATLEKQLQIEKSQAMPNTDIIEQSEEEIRKIETLLHNLQEMN
jgi:hypothetical protein